MLSRSVEPPVKTNTYIIKRWICVFLPFPLLGAASWRQALLWKEANAYNRMNKIKKARSSEVEAKHAEAAVKAREAK